MVWNPYSNIDHHVLAWIADLPILLHRNQDFQCDFLYINLTVSNTDHVLIVLLTLFRKEYETIVLWLNELKTNFFFHKVYILQTFVLLVHLVGLTFASEDIFSSFLYHINTLIKRHTTNYQEDKSSFTEVALNKIASINNAEAQFCSRSWQEFKTVRS